MIKPHLTPLISDTIFFSEKKIKIKILDEIMQISITLNAQNWRSTGGTGGKRN